MRTAGLAVTLAAAVLAATLLGSAAASAAEPTGSSPGGGRWGGDRGPDPERMQQRAEAARTNQIFQALSDPLVRSEIGLAPEQEAQIVELQEKMRKTLDRTRDQVSLDYGMEDPSESLPPEQVEARRREMTRAYFEALRNVRPELEALMKEVIGLLTEEQLGKLKELLEGRGALGWGTGDLWILTTTRVKEELGLSDEQVKSIRDILKGGAEKLQAMRQEVFAPSESATPENRAGDMRQRIDTFRQRQTEIVNETRELALAVLDPDQRAKAEERFQQRAEEQKKREEELRQRFQPFGGGPDGGPGGGFGGGPRGPRDRMGPEGGPRGPRGESGNRD